MRFIPHENVKSQASRIHIICLVHCLRKPKRKPLAITHELHQLPQREGDLSYLARADVRFACGTAAGFRAASVDG